MRMTDMVEIDVSGNCLSWYRDKGYFIPTVKIQLWMTNRKGIKVKNGIEHRVPLGTKIMVRREDLHDQSSKRLNFVCESCGNTYWTVWCAYKKKKTKNCKACVLSTVKYSGEHVTWVKKLIKNNPNAKCDISGETDKRFLELHHLLSRKICGKNEESNYVILSANYHRAFHSWLGGSTTPCRPEDYYEFRKLEMAGEKPKFCKRNFPRSDGDQE